MDVRKDEIDTFSSLVLIRMPILPQLRPQLRIFSFRLFISFINLALNVRRRSARASAEIDKSVFSEIGGAEDGLEGVGDEGGGRGGLEEGCIEFPEEG